MQESNEGKRNALLHVCLEYLERYYVLIAFTAYLFEPGFDPTASSQPSFRAWLAARPELKRCTMICDFLKIADNIQGCWPEECLDRQCPGRFVWMKFGLRKLRTTRDFINAQCA